MFFSYAPGVGEAPLFCSRAPLPPTHTQHSQTPSCMMLMSTTHFDSGAGGGPLSLHALAAEEVGALADAKAAIAAAAAGLASFLEEDAAPVDGTTVIVPDAGSGGGGGGGLSTDEETATLSSQAPAAISPQPPLSGLARPARSRRPSARLLGEADPAPSPGRKASKALSAAGCVRKRASGKRKAASPAAVDACPARAPAAPAPALPLSAAPPSPPPLLLLLLARPARPRPAPSSLNPRRPRARSWTLAASKKGRPTACPPGACARCGGGSGRACGPRWRRCVERMRACGRRAACRPCRPSRPCPPRP